MPDGVTLRQRVMGLDDDEAARALYLLAEHEYRDDVTSMATAWDSIEPNVRDALADPALEAYVPAIDIPATDGELARMTLLHVAAVSPPQAELVDQAVRYVKSPAQRFGLETLAVGGLVLVVLQTEVRLERQADGRWRFVFQKKAVSDSTLGHVLSALISRFTGSSK